MLNEDLQAKLTETEKERDLWKSHFDSQAEGNVMLMSMLAQYKCKACALYHFPEPIETCERTEDNDAMREHAKQVREQFLTEFRAALKQSIDERGESGWRFIDEYLHER